MSAGIFAVGISKFANKMIDKSTNINTSSWLTKDGISTLENAWNNSDGNSKKYIPITADIKKKRMNSVYKIDNKSKRRSSYQNKVLKGIYSNYIGVPYGDVAKELLHVKH